MNKELYMRLICALSHSIDTCSGCGKCKGKDGVEVRLELIREIAALNGYELPWVENDID